MSITVHPDDTWSYEEEGVLRHPRSDGAVLPHSTAIPFDRIEATDTESRSPPHRPHPNVTRLLTEASASAPYETKAGHWHEPPDARSGADLGDAWNQIDAEAARSLKHFLAARRLVDFTGPLGWDRSAVDAGRIDQLDSGPLGPVEAALRKVHPLIELRSPFTSPGPNWQTPTAGRSISISMRSSLHPGRPRSPRTTSSSTGTCRVW